LAVSATTPSALTAEDVDPQRALEKGGEAGDERGAVGFGAIVG
jgi:hypothetical protein